MTQVLAQPAQALQRPLCVDLDGTLTKVDTLYDTFMLLVRKNPRALLQVPGWLAGGKANLKQHLTRAVALDVTRLPYNQALLAYLHEQRQLGRPIFLATGADRELAARVAAHLGLFDGVLASDGTRNLTGKRKLDRFREFFAGRDFDYIGNAMPDLELLAASVEPRVANPSMALRSSLRGRGIRVQQSFDDRAPFFPSLIRAIRVHQWAKNALIFLPFILGHKWNLDVARLALLAFFCFSFCASGTYIVNDLLDIEADRHHLKKRMRPFAAGDLSVVSGVALGFLLVALSALCAAFLPRAFLFWLGMYFLCTLAYSFQFKRMVLVDVLALSGLYTLRLLAGGAATSTAISHWLSGFSIFLFLSLAIVKRFAELQNTLQGGLTPKNGRGYQLSDIEQMRSFGTASAFAAVVVFANYISGLDVIALYHQPRLLWLIVPLLILWLCRVWLLASRGELNEDPVVFALTDRMSLLIGAAVAAIALLAQ
ncbi:UbiA family prenyltransferase [Acidobacteria bacterium AB60]|nr:UbiA family prenyltransferase [Acidobacteria bacterium AB60]